MILTPQSRLSQDRNASALGDDEELQGNNTGCAQPRAGDEHPTYEVSSGSISFEDDSSDDGIDISDDGAETNDRILSNSKCKEIFHGVQAVQKEENLAQHVQFLIKKVKKAARGEGKK